MPTRRQALSAMFGHGSRHGERDRGGGGQEASLGTHDGVEPDLAPFDADLVAGNPGDWMLHCHNAYHAETGMMTRLDYQL